MPESLFKKRVIAVVRAIPYGRVASYGQVALLCGAPRASREVGWVLNRLEKEIEVPWWRVLNNKGEITIKGSTFSADFQRKLLQSENILVSDDFLLSMHDYRWIPTGDEMKQFELPSDYLKTVNEKLRNY
mgnify:FL=1